MNKFYAFIGKVVCFGIVILLILFLLVCCEDDEEECSDGSCYEYEEDCSDGNCYEYDDDCSDGSCYNYDDYDRQYSSYEFKGNLGSASELSGTTVLVSIFADDWYTSWEAADKTKNNTIKYMKIATDWISKQCSNYGVSANFIYDWSKNSDIYYETTFDLDLTADNNYLFYDENDYVDAYVDTASIIDKYNADNVIYVIFVNTDDYNERTSVTYPYIVDSTEYPNEIITMTCHCDGYEENPASFAHEILHAFGAPDLYMADEYGDNYGITEAYVRELENTYSNDIMFTTYDNYTGDVYYDRITNELSELDAYYVGLTDYSSVKEEWGFEDSQH